VGKNNWYLDHLSVKVQCTTSTHHTHPTHHTPYTIKWSDEYAWDPVIAGVKEENVLGGEGCMWGETVDISDFDSTVWPRMSRYSAVR
jgi:hypothetical protein